MIRICIDTNALFGDPLWLKPSSKRLLSHAAAGRCQVHLSPVVDAEIRRKIADQARADVDSIRSRIRTFAERHQIEHESLLDALERFRQAAVKAAYDRDVDLRRSEGFGTEGWPAIDAQALVERELARRRPFIDTGKGTIGQRDTVIWHGVLDAAQNYPEDEVVFVPQDNGFLLDKVLHPDLIGDLREAGLDPTIITVVPDIVSALGLLDRTFAKDRHAQLVAAVREALHEYNRELWQIQRAPDYDPRDGGVLEPEVDLGLPLTFEDVNVSSIESAFDVTLDPEDPERDQPFECTYEVLIDFNGAMAKSEWYSAGSDDDLELWDPDLNDHYVVVHAERRVQLTVAMRYDDTTDTATVDELVRGRRA